MWSHLVQHFKVGYRNPSFFINLFTKCLREQGSYKKKKIIGRTLSVRRWEDKDSKSYKHKRLHKSQVTSEVWVFDQESTQSLIGENVHGFDSRAHSHTHTVICTHTLEIITCCVAAFSSSPSEPLGETSQLQSHLPPLSLCLIQHITNSPKSLFPW